MADIVKAQNPANVNFSLDAIEEEMGGLSWSSNLVAEHIQVSVGAGDLVIFYCSSATYSNHGNEVFRQWDEYPDDRKSATSFSAPNDIIDAPIVHYYEGIKQSSHNNPGYVVIRLVKEGGTLDLYGVPYHNTVDLIETGYKEGVDANVDVIMGHSLEAEPEFKDKSVDKSDIVVGWDEDAHDPLLCAEFQSSDHRRSLGKKYEEAQRRDGSHIGPRGAPQPYGYHRHYLQATDSSEVSPKDIGGGQEAYILSLNITLHDPEPNKPPIADIQANPTQGQEDLEVSFDGTDSYDPDGKIKEYRWDFDDNETISHSVNNYQATQPTGFSQEITPLKKLESLKEFYDYYNAEAHTNPDIEKYEVSIVFLYQDKLTGDLGLGIIHSNGDGEKDDTGSITYGGMSNYATLQFSGFSDETEIVVQDDDEFRSSSDSDVNRKFAWNYHNNKTDGIAFNKLGNIFEITIDPRRWEGIGDWQVVSGDIENPDYYSVDDMNEPVTISSPNADPGTPSHVYSAGTYEPSLKVYDDDGLSDEDSTKIQVDKLKPPVADFLRQPAEGQVNLNVVCDARDAHDPDGNIVEYEWNFGDGSGTTTGDSWSAQFVSHTYTSTGTYEVKLTVTDDDGLTDTLTKTVRVEEQEYPVSKVSASPTSGKADLDVDIDGTNSYHPRGHIKEYSWDYKNGNTESGTTDIFTFEQNGSVIASVNSIVRAGNISDYYPDGRNNDLGKYETCVVWLHRSTNTGKLSFVVYFNDSSGSETNLSNEAEIDFSGFPSDSYVTAQDDAPEDRYDINSTIHWNWHNALGDGVAFSNMGEEFSITLDPNFISGVTSWEIVTGTPSSPNYTSIPDLDAPLTISTSPADPGTSTQTYSSGNYSPSLTITGPRDLTDTESVELSVSALDNPVARFDRSPEQGSPDLTVDFDASASEDPDGSIESYDWDFDDGSTGSGETTSHTYTTSGTYNPQLTVTDSDGLTGSTTKTVYVETPENPVAVVTVSPTSGKVPLNVSFDGTDSYDPDGNIVEHEWDFGDGTTESDTTAPGTTSHTYDSYGLYSATLWVKDDQGLSDEVSVNISVADTEAPVAEVDAIPSQGKVPLDVSFDGSQSYDLDGNITSYDWDFGDGNTATGSSPSHTYSSSGTYTATLTVTDDDGLTGSKSVNIEAKEQQGPVAKVSASPQSGQEPLTVSLYGDQSYDPDGYITSYEWEFGDGSTATGMSQSHQFSSGDYQVTLTVTDSDGHTDKDRVKIEVSPELNPIARFTATPKGGPIPLEVEFDARESNDPDGKIYSHNWEFGDGEKGRGSIVSHTYDGPGVYTVTLEVEDDDGLTDSISKKISAIVPVEQRDEPDRDFTLSASVRTTNEFINKLNWVYQAKNTNINSFNIYKGKKGENKKLIDTVTDSEYTDNEVTSGVPYEYEIVGNAHWKSNAEFSRSITEAEVTKGDIILMYEDASISDVTSSGLGYNIQARQFGPADSYLKIYAITSSGKLTTNANKGVEIIRTGKEGIAMNGTPDVTTSKADGTIGPIGEANPGSIIIQWSGTGEAINQRSWSFGGKTSFLYDEYPRDENDVEGYRRIDQAIDKGTLGRANTGDTPITLINLDYSETPLRQIESSARDTVTARPGMTEVDIR